ncbi:MAG: glutamine-hydrolyzing carbamoyl-phosphate synthase small subunit [Clostridiales bacterium]
MKAVLVIEDGSYYTGEAFGAFGEAFGEIVFNTSMTGYQEITTDPSYNGQMVVMTYPLIGNYGFNNDDNESYKTHIQGFIVKEFCDHASNWRINQKNEEYFKFKNIVGIKNIDTRKLTQELRKNGTMFGVISTKTGNTKTLLESLKKEKEKKRNLVMEVTTKVPINHLGKGKKIVLIDFGTKYNIPRILENLSCNLSILPAYSNYKEILKYNPDGIVLSNGPGNPEDLPDIIETIKRLLGEKPILGICLGHQLLGLALGGKTYKLKFGHHGSNHPVKDLQTNKCYITSQNHNYALSNEIDSSVEITHINLNDSTIEGFKHKNLKVLSIQYHPEASPGPTDSGYIFNEFLSIL